MTMRIHRDDLSRALAIVGSARDVTRLQTIYKGVSLHPTPEGLLLATENGAQRAYATVDTQWEVSTETTWPMWLLDYDTLANYVEAVPSGYITAVQSGGRFEVVCDQGKAALPLLHDRMDAGVMHRPDWLAQSRKQPVTCTLALGQFRRAIQVAHAGLSPDSTDRPIYNAVWLAVRDGALYASGIGDAQSYIVHVDLANTWKYLDTNVSALVPTLAVRSLLDFLKGCEAVKGGHDALDLHINDQGSQVSLVAGGRGWSTVCSVGTYPDVLSFVAKREYPTATGMVPLVELLRAVQQAEVLDDGKKSVRIYVGEERAEGQAIQLQCEGQDGGLVTANLLVGCEGPPSRIRLQAERLRKACTALRTTGGTDAILRFGLPEKQEMIVQSDITDDIHVQIILPPLFWM